MHRLVTGTSFSRRWMSSRCPTTSAHCCLWRRSDPCTTISTNAAALCNPRRNFIDSNTDAKKWFDPSVSDVKRQNAGVKLGSREAQMRKIAEHEKAMLMEDRFDSYFFWKCSVGGVLMVFYLLNSLVPEPGDDVGEEDVNKNARKMMHALPYIEYVPIAYGITKKLTSELLQAEKEANIAAEAAGRPGHGGGLLKRVALFDVTTCKVALGDFTPNTAAGGEEVDVGEDRLMKESKLTPSSTFGLRLELSLLPPIEVALRQPAEEAAFMGTASGQHETVANRGVLVQIVSFASVLNKPPSADYALPVALRDAVTKELQKAFGPKSKVVVAAR